MNNLWTQSILKRIVMPNTTSKHYNVPWATGMNATTWELF